MGVYSTGEIHGVRWFNSDVFYSRTVPEAMGLAQLLDIKAEYAKLTDAQKSAVQLQFYSPCASTYNYPSTPFMMWFPGEWATVENYIAVQQNGAQNAQGSA